MKLVGLKNNIIYMLLFVVVSCKDKCFFILMY